MHTMLSSNTHTIHAKGCLCAMSIGVHYATSIAAAAAAVVVVVVVVVEQSH